MLSAPNTDELTIRLELDPLTAAPAPQSKVSSSGRKANFLRQLIRQPLAHFLLAGIVLFVAASLLERVRNSSADIRVSSVEIQRLRDVWTRQYGRSPDTSQMQNLIADYIREEVYYREALASGFDKDDSIIRRRLVEKMEFLSQEIASDEPREQELQAYFDRNREKFRVPAQVAFTHIFFSTSRRPNAEHDAHQALAILQKRQANADPAMGDPFMLQNEYPLQTKEEVKSLFGEEFANSLFQLGTGEWQGPIRSSYGWHLVRISQAIPSRLPELSEVRQQVTNEFKNERLQNASDAYYARLRNRYRIHIDDAAFANASSQIIPPHPSQPAPQPDED
jgi:peptidyl-prolyl cis-trans isomerase C